MDRQQLLEGLRANRDKLPAIIRDHASEIEGILAKYNSFDILSCFSFIELAVDPETYREWSHDGLFAAVEYVALLCLKGPFNDSEEEHIDPSDIIQLKQHSHAALMNAVWYYASEHLDKTSGDADPVMEELRFKSVLNTMFVRCHTYRHHLRELMQALVDGVSGTIESQLGFSVDDALQIEDAFSRITANRIHERRKEAYAFVGHFAKQVEGCREKHGDPEGEIEKVVAEIAKLDPNETEVIMDHMGQEYTFHAIGEIMSCSAEELAEEAGIATERVIAFLERVFKSRFWLQSA
ncbi:MAG: hypothetical protein RJP95_02490 [Pirellulales bacterium]